MLGSILDRIFSDRRSPKSRKRANSLDNRRRLFLETLENRALMAALTTDALDYAPASTAYLTASDFPTGAAITFQVVHADALDSGAGHDPWTVIDGSADDMNSADGIVTTSWYVNPDDSEGATLLATATDGVNTASTTFTDQAFNGAIYTSKSNGTQVNQNLYDSKADVYLNGGPQNDNGQGLPDGVYYYEVTNPSGDTLLSTDAADCRQLVVSGGMVAGSYSGGPVTDTDLNGIWGDGTIICYHAVGTLNSSNGSTPVQLIPFSDTPNPGGEYKVHLIRQTSDTVVGLDGIHISYNANDDKSDNFKVGEDDDPVVKQSIVEISGFKFEDANGDGDIADDSHIAWATINFDDDTDDTSVIASTSATDASGYSFAIIGTSIDDGPYSFVLDADGDGETTGDQTDLSETTYYIYETADADWTQTYGIGGYTINLDTATGDGTVTTDEGDIAFDLLHFGNFENIDISGTKYEDLNGNGAENIDDGPLGDFVFILNDDGDGVPEDGERTTTSAANGTWSFDNVGPGAWTVTEAYAGAHWVLIQGEEGYSGVAASGVDVTTGLTFGNFETIELRGTKYTDHKGDDTGSGTDTSPDDTALPGWPVQLYTFDGITLTAVGDPQDTGPDGSYKFENLGPLPEGTSYVVDEVTDSAWTQTFGVGGYTVAATSGNTGGGDFANFENIDICGEKYQDHNGDGFAGTNNLTVLGGFVIYLDGSGTTTANGKFDYTDSNGNGRFDVATDVALESFRITDSDGEYCFTNLGPGTYRVQESTANQTDPANWIQTGGNGGYTVVAASGVDRPSVNDPAHFGDFANVHIGSHGGLTIGFYSNKNGQALLSTTPTGTTIKGPIATYLKSVLANSASPGNSVLVLGTSYLTLADLCNYTKLSNVLKQATATNMANMLSAQLLATVLNCYFTGTTGVSATQSIYLPAMTRLSGKSNATVQNWLQAGGINTTTNPGVKTSAGDKYVTIQELICAAVKELKTNKNTTATSKDRNFQEALKSTFDGINNGDPIFVL